MTDGLGVLRGSADLVNQLGPMTASTESGIYHTALQEICYTEEAVNRARRLLGKTEHEKITNLVPPDITTYVSKIEYLDVEYWPTLLPP